MKRIAIIALTFVLAGCIMTGCRRNDMRETTGTNGTGGNTTITTVPEVTTIPHPSTHATEHTVITEPMDGTNGTDEAMPRNRTHKPNH